MAAINKIAITQKPLPDFIITLLLLKFCLSALTDSRAIANCTFYKYIMFLPFCNRKDGYLSGLSYYCESFAP